MADILTPNKQLLNTFLEKFKIYSNDFIKKDILNDIQQKFNETSSIQQNNLLTILENKKDTEGFREFIQTLTNKMDSSGASHSAAVTRHPKTTPVKNSLNELSFDTKSKEIKITKIESKLEKIVQNSSKLKEITVTKQKPLPDRKILAIDSLNENQHLKNKEEEKDDNTNAILNSLEVDHKLLSPNKSNMKYEILEATNLVNLEKNQKNHRMKETNTSIIFLDKNIAEDYRETVLSITETLNKALGTKEYEQLFKESKQKIAALNKEYLKTYTSDNPSAFAGVKIVRSDMAGRTTNLVNSTYKLEVSTNGLTDSDAIRLRLASGSYLNLNLDKDGNFDVNKDPLESVVFLTAEGSNEKKLFNGTENNPDIVYNNYERIEKDLKKLRIIKVNGINIRDTILKSLELKKQKYKNLTSANENLGNTENAEKVEDKTANTSRFQPNLNNLSHIVPADYSKNTQKLKNIKQSEKSNSISIIH